MNTSTNEDALPLTYTPPTLTEYGSLHTLIRGTGSQLSDGDGNCSNGGEQPGDPEIDCN